MGRVRPSIPRSRVPWWRRLLMDPAAIRSWLTVLGLAACVALAVGHTVASAERAEASWGSSTPVLVVDQRLDAGAPLRTVTSTRRWPKALLPRSALTELPEGAVAAGALDEGTVLTAALVRSRDARSEERTVSLPVGAGPLPVRVGDRVDLWATLDPTLVPDGSEATGRVASDARVVASDDRAVVVAVDADEVAGVIDAVASAVVSLSGSG